MAQRKVKVQHNLTQSAALTCIKGLLPALQQEFGDKIRDLEHGWNDMEGKFSFETMGGKVSGTVTVAATDVTVIVDLPFVVNATFGKKIESELKTRAQAALDSCVAA